jgi:hypothetical protein
MVTHRYFSLLKKQLLLPSLFKMPTFLFGAIIRISFFISGASQFPRDPLLLIKV